MNPLSIDPLDNLKQRNIVTNLETDDPSVPVLVGKVSDLIDDASDIRIDQFELLEYPDSDNITEFIETASDDLQNARVAIKAIPNIITEEYNSTTTGIAITDDKISNLQDSLNSLKKAVEKRGSTNKFFISNNLTNKASIDYDFPVSAPYASVDLTLGAATLLKRDSEPIKNATFKVFKSNKSNERDVYQEKPVDFFYEGRYYGYADSIIPEGDSLHLGLKTNPTRLESGRATEAEKDEVRKRVFDDDIDTAWVCEYVQSSANPDTSPLEVELLIDLQAVYTVSNLSLNPFLLNLGDTLDILEVKAGPSSSDMTKLSIFVNELVEDPNEKIDKPVATSGPYNGNYSNQINIDFDPVEARYLSLSVSQANLAGIEYPTVMIPLSRTNPDNNITETQKFSLDYLQSIAVASKYSDDLPSNTLLAAVFNLGGGWSVGSDLSKKVHSDRMHQAIGISELLLNNNIYEESSEFVSSSFLIANKKIKSVSLRVDELIPSPFPDQDWILYYISFDGNTFTPISPAGAGRRDDGIESTLFPAEADSITFKAVFSRPGDASSLSPVLKGYQIEVVTE